MFAGDELKKAIGVPLYYGLVEMVILAIFCITCWKAGWTKAPADENFCRIIATSYEVEAARQESPNAIEVVHSNNPTEEGDVENLVFNQTVDGFQVDENSMKEKTNAGLQESRRIAKDSPHVEEGEFT